MMNYWYLLKILWQWKSLKKVTPYRLKLLWKILTRASTLPLKIGPSDTEVELSIAPPNLYALVLLMKAGLRPRVEKPDELSWELAPGRFFHTRLRQGMDLMVLYEIFVRQDYGTDFSGKVVLDVGAYNGDSAVFFALRGAKRVIALEPYPPSYALAEANIARMGLQDKILLLQGALGASEGKATFRIASAEPSANALAPTSLIERLVEFDEVMEVNVYTLSQLAATYGPFDFVKLDCEGCEFAVVKEAPDALLKAIPLWHIEYHAAPSALEARFRALGFQVVRAKERLGLGYLRAWR